MEIIVCISRHKHFRTCYKKNKFNQEQFSSQFALSLSIKYQIIRVLTLWSGARVVKNKILLDKIQ